MSRSIRINTLYSKIMPDSPGGKRFTQRRRSAESAEDREKGRRDPYSVK